MQPHQHPPALLCAGTSVKNLAHWAQAIRRSRERRHPLFEMYDYGHSCVTPRGLPQTCNMRRGLPAPADAAACAARHAQRSALCRQGGLLLHTLATVCAWRCTPEPRCACACAPRRVYNRVEPPSYDLGSIAAALAIFSGAADRLADPEDVATLLAALSPDAIVYQQVRLAAALGRVPGPLLLRGFGYWLWVLGHRGCAWAARHAVLQLGSQLEAFPPFYQPVSFLGPGRRSPATATWTSPGALTPAPACTLPCWTCCACTADALTRTHRRGPGGGTEHAAPQLVPVYEWDAEPSQFSSGCHSIAFLSFCRNNRRRGTPLPASAAATAGSSGKAG